MSTVDTNKTVEQDLGKINYLVQNHSIQIKEFSKQLNDKQQLIQKLINEFENNLLDLKSDLKQLIESTEKPWFQESYRLYEEMKNDNNYVILNRRPRLASETDQFYRSRLARYNSWQHPAIIIRPGLETYINELLATDPLYLVDQNQDLLEPAMNMFNEQYRQRLRTYTINEIPDQDILTKLPTQQFGLVFAYNFFNTRPFEIIRKYFVEIYQKLRPGGVLVLTFNDCDRPEAIKLVENHFGCYTPGYLVKELAQSLGYEIEFSWHDQGPITWLELRKPGKFESLRGGQSLAKIISK
jgi:SAM-dependent methyltransferase